MNLPQRDIVVIGASSGGLEALLEIVPRLPKDLPASIFIVVHVPAQARSQLPPDPQPRRAAAGGPSPGQRQDRARPHLRGAAGFSPAGGGRLCACAARAAGKQSPPGDRPAVPDGRRAYGPRVAGIILSGTLDDGVAGLFAVKSRGGVAVIQDPQDALFSDMPRNALAAVTVDHRLPKREIGRLIAELAQAPAQREAGAPMTQQKNGDDLEKESCIEGMDRESIEDDDKPGVPSVYACPDCGGVLWELEEEERLRYRCRVGHAYSANGLLRTQGESLEAALWSAFRVLQEQGRWRGACTRGRAAMVRTQSPRSSAGRRKQRGSTPS